MSRLRRTLDALLGRLPPAPPPPPQTKAAGIGPAGAFDALRLFLGGSAPGWWASDHLEESRHFTNWNYVAGHAVAKQAAAASACAYRKKPKPPPGAAPITKSLTAPDANDPDREDLPETHPLARLLDRPNPYQSGSAFRYVAAQQLRLTGSALVWAVFNPLGLPVELWVVPTALAQPQPPNVNYPLGAYWVTSLGTSGYGSDPGWQFGLPGGYGAMVDARHVRRIRWPHPLYLGDGLSPTSACALWSDIADDIDRTTAATFRREIRGGKEIITDEVAGVVPNEEMLRRLAAELNAKYAGAENAGQTIVYPPGAKPQNNRAPSELDFVAGRPVARDAVLAAHATPATAVGVSEAAAYAAYVAAMQQWIDLSVQPDLDLLAGELTHFLAPYFGGDVCVEILAKRPDDPQMTKLKLDSLQAGGAVTVNEQRAAWGMPPVPWGDEKPQAPGESPAQPGAPPTEVGGVPDAPAAKRTGQKRPDLASMPRAVNLRAGNAPRGPAGVNGTGGGHG